MFGGSVVSRPIDHVPGDLFPDLLDVAPGVPWIGPCSVRWLGGHWLTGCTAFGRSMSGILTIDECGDTLGARPASELHLSLTRPEGRHQLARVLAAGRRCACPSCTHEDAHVEWDTNALLCRECDEANGCVVCDGTGYTRKPAPVWWMLPESEGGKIPAVRSDWSPGLLACSAHRVKAGLEAVVGIAGVWRLFDDGRWIRTSIEGTPLPYPYHFSRDEAGKVVADADALALGWALTNPEGTLTLPWPEATP